MCRAAVEKLYTLSKAAESPGKAELSQEILATVSCIKELFQIQKFSKANQDCRSFVPESFECGLEKLIVLRQVDFQEVLQAYSQHHVSVCQVFESSCGSIAEEQKGVKAGVCITTLKTETQSTATEDDTHDETTSRKGLRKLGSPGAAGAQEKWGKEKMENWAYAPAFGVPSAPQLGRDGDAALNHAPSGSHSDNSWSLLSELSPDTSWEEVGYPGGATSPLMRPGPEDTVNTTASSAEFLAGSGEWSSQPTGPSELMNLKDLRVVGVGALVAKAKECSRNAPAPPTQPCGPAAAPAPTISSPQGSLATGPSFEEAETFEILGEFAGVACENRGGQGETRREGTSQGGPGPTRRLLSGWVDPEEETAESTAEVPVYGKHLEDPTGDYPKVVDSSLALGRSTESPTSEGSAGRVWGLQGAHLDTSILGSKGVYGPWERRPGSCGPPAHGRGRVPVPVGLDEDCTTEEGARGPDAGSPARFSASSDVESPSSLRNASASSFESLPEPLKKRTLQPQDLEKLLAGVQRDWLFRRLAGTGLFEGLQLHQAHRKYCMYLGPAS